MAKASGQLACATVVGGMEMIMAVVVGHPLREFRLVLRRAVERMEMFLLLEEVAAQSARPALLSALAVLMQGTKGSHLATGLHLAADITLAAAVAAASTEGGPFRAVVTHARIG